MNWYEFFFMGGYALYIWGAYAVTFVAMGGEVILLIRRQKAVRDHMQTFRSIHEVET
jgi:heme exporter protein D